MKKRNQWKKLFALLGLILTFSAKGDYWTQKADFGGAARYGAVGFSIGTKGYIGTGGNPLGLNDFWEYDPSLNIWTQKTNVPGNPRVNAMGFSIGAKGYIGGGHGGVGLKDFWEYDPSLNIWTQKADIGGGARSSGVGFSIGNKGYFGTGCDFSGCNSTYFWEYNPLLNIWIPKANLGGLGVQMATGYSDGTYGYIGTGVNYSTGMQYSNEFWSWDPTTNVWTQMANFGGIPRAEACAFWLCPFGYLGTGTSNIPTSALSDFWKYDRASNSWVSVANFGAGLREFASTFSIGNKGYVGVGWINDGNLHSDFWEYTPDTVCLTGIEEVKNSDFQLHVSPNPSKDFININWSSNTIIKTSIEISIWDINSKKVFYKNVLVSNNNLIVDFRNFTKGVYFIEVNVDSKRVVKKIYKE